MADRQVYIEKFKAQIDECEARLSALEAKAREASAEARQDYADRIADLRQTRDAAEQRLRDFADSAWSSGEEMRKGFEAAWRELGKEADRADSRA